MITVLLFLATSFQVNAKTPSEVITLSLTNVPIEKVFKEIEKQSGYHFFYNGRLLKQVKKVSINVSNAPVKTVLEICFKDQPIAYEIDERQIVVKVREIPPLDRKVLYSAAVTPPREITGLVTNGQGEPLADVSIVIKGSSGGTKTNRDGKFTLQVNDNATLIFSYVGFLTQEVAVNNERTISIQLKEDAEAMKDVVVTALGIKRAVKTLGYATATVNNEQIATNKTTNFINALQGKMAGVNITQMGTGPAGSTKIRIRGQSSLGADNNPMIVVNGIPINNSSFGIGGNNPTRGTGTSDGGDGLSSINPDDIETMTVLKGAAAAALYGSRAKDGVIMITTRNKGNQQGIGVELTSNATFDQALDYTDFQDQYGEGENGVRPTTPDPTSGVFSFGEKFAPKMTQTLFDNVVVPYELQKDRYKHFYRTGRTLTNTITVSSSGDKGGFNLSVSNLDNTNIVPNAKFNRKTINLGFTQNITSKFNVSGNINYSKEKNTNPPVISGNGFNIPLVINTLSTSMPLDLLDQKRYDENGNERVYSRFRNRTNPFISAYDRFENINRDRFFGNITARYNFADWIYLQGRVGQDYFARNRDYNNPTGIAFLTPAPPGFFNGIYNQETSSFREVNADFLVGANRKFNDFGVNVTAGGNQRYVRTEMNSVFVQDFSVRNIYTLLYGRSKEPTYSLSERKINSLYGAAEISFRDYLFVNATARNDWFSTLSPANRSILYPSVTGSFVFSQALRGFVPEWISFGKLRASYAQVGSDLDIQPYSNLLFYGVNANLFTSYDGSVQPVGLINTNIIPNANLHPMSVSEMEFGFELKMFQQRLGLDFTYYKKLSTDQILSAQTSDASAYTSQLINVGESRTSGIEVLLTGTPVQTRNFQWNASVNFAYNTSKVLKLGTSDKDVMIGGNLRYVVGKPLGQIYGYGYLRDAQGRQVFDKLNGLALRTPDLIRLGSALPKYFGGITNQFNYKGIVFTSLIDFKLGHQMFSQTNWNAYRHGLHRETLVGREENYVIGVGVNQDGGVNTTKAPLQQFYTIDNTQIREGFVQNAGFWKLRQLSLGYDFSKYLPKSKFIKGLRLNGVANNVLIIKKWIPNIDPEEFSNVNDTQIGLGGDGGMPTTRTIGFNLNVKF